MNHNQIEENKELDKSGNVVQSNFFALIKRKWILFLTIALIAAIAGFLYANFQKPQYKSRLTFALDDGGSGMNSIAGLASQFGINIGSSDKDIFQGENILEIIKSRRMIERVLLSVDTVNNKSCTLIDRYLVVSKKFIKNKRLSNVHFPAGQSKASFSYLQDSVLKVIYLNIAQNQLQARKSDRKLNIYEVNFTTPDENLSKVFTDRIVYETSAFYTEIRTKKAGETLKILEERVASMKGNLSSSISSKASAQDANLNPAFSASQAPAAFQQANIRVYGEAYAEMFKNLEIARFQYLNEIPLLQIIDAADYPLERIKMSRLKTAILFSFIATVLLCIYILFRYSARSNDQV